MRSPLQSSAFKDNGSCSDWAGPPSLCALPNFSNTEAPVFTSRISDSKSGGLLSKFKADVDRIRNRRGNKRRSFPPPALTGGRNVRWESGQPWQRHSGNTSPSLCWTNTQEGGGLRLRTDRAAEPKVSSFRTWLLNLLKVER